MKRNVIRYLFLSVSVIVFGLTLTWLVTHFQKPNLKKASIKRDYEKLIELRLSQEEVKPEPVQTDFTVREGETVYVKSLKGKEVNQFIKDGKVTIVNQAGEVIYEYRLLDDILTQQINLPAGEYKIMESMTLNEEAVLSYVLPTKEGSCFLPRHR